MKMSYIAELSYSLFKVSELRLWRKKVESSLRIDTDAMLNLKKIIGGYV